MKRKTLTGESIGVVFGTFAPMHTGHVDLIQQAKRENDQVLVIVSGTNTDRDRGTQIGLHLNRRFRYVREVFRDDELVAIDKLDEENMPAYPDGWSEWLNDLNNLIDKNTALPYPHLTFYVGEPDYVNHLESFYEAEGKAISHRLHIANNNHARSRADIKLMKRSVIPISATKIRNNPFEYWHYITKPFRRHFTKKILVIGSASGGKTTLVKDLGRAYNAPISLEFAREYQNRYNVTDEELDVKDYIHLLADQYQQTANIIDSGSHSGIIFADTNSAVTKAYIDYYLKDEISEEEYDMLSQLYEVTIKREQWDLIILISPETEYVDDGFRDMTMSDQSIRDEFTQHLIELMKPFNDKLHILTYTDRKQTFFAQNYQNVKQLIFDELGFEV